MFPARYLPVFLLLCQGLVACGDKLNPVLTETADAGTAQDGISPTPSTPAVPGAPDNATPVGGANMPVTVPSDPALPTVPITPAPSTPAPVTPAPPTSAGLCGTDATTISYEGQAKAVIAVSCLGCHLGRGPVLNNYAASKAGFNTGGGLVAVEGGTMPIGGVTLTTEQKCILTSWAAGGYQP